MSSTRTLNNKTSNIDNRYNSYARGWNNIAGQAHPVGQQQKMKGQPVYSKGMFQPSRREGPYNYSQQFQQQDSNNPTLFNPDFSRSAKFKTSRNILNNRYVSNKYSNNNQNQNQNQNQNHRNQDSGSYNKNSKQNGSLTGNGKVFKYKMIHDVGELHDSDDLSKKREVFNNRYFSTPVDLENHRDEDGKLKPYIKILPKSFTINNSKTYKLSVPMDRKKESYKILKGLIEDVYRNLYNKAQPFIAIGNEDDKTMQLESLEEVVHKLVERLRSTDISLSSKETNSGSMDSTSKLPVTATRQLVDSVTGNDSFDLSFDGKALDRSDILRMVDSFSVVFSDDDNEDENNEFMTSISNTILPAEITSSVI